MSEETPTVKESIKLIKMSKGYNWEIRIIGTGLNNLFTEDDYNRLKIIEKKISDDYSLN